MRDKEEGAGSKIDPAKPKNLNENVSFSWVEATKDYGERFYE
jgi:hypothetical protein